MTFEDVKRIRENPTAEDCDNKELSRLIDIALEKQIPKKPLNIGGRYWGKAKGGNCAVCGAGVNSLTYKFCYKCGQALDWSKDNE